MAGDVDDRFADGSTGHFDGNDFVAVARDRRSGAAGSVRGATLRRSNSVAVHALHGVAFADFFVRDLSIR